MWNWDMTLFMIHVLTLFQDSSFSFLSCLPSGWTVLLFSSLVTFISERVFLDQDKFFATFLIHFSVGVSCLTMSAYIMYAFKILLLHVNRDQNFNYFSNNSGHPKLRKYLRNYLTVLEFSWSDFYPDFLLLIIRYRGERAFINKIVRFREHADWIWFFLFSISSR